jgi:hypothetical protein
MKLASTNRCEQILIHDSNFQFILVINMNSGFINLETKAQHQMINHTDAPTRERSGGHKRAAETYPLPGNVCTHQKLGTG